MKKIIILLVCSFAFSGTVWLSIDGTPEAELCVMSICGTEDLDGGGMTVAYTHPVYSSGSMDLAVGGGYMIVPWDFGGDVEGGQITAFMKASWGFGSGAAGWAQFGLAVPTEDMDDGDTGFEYGVGFDYSVNDQMTVGLGFMISSFSEEIADGVDMDLEFNRMVINLGYGL